MKILCTICARGGSKGVPNKNIRILKGKPLIAYTIEQALQCKIINRVVVSTDSENIAKIAKQYGAEVPFLRPAELARDESPKLAVIQHAVRFFIEQVKYVPDYVVDLDPTAPLRKKDDIIKCIDLINDDPVCDSVITGYRSNKNPYFNMVECDSDGFSRLSHRLEHDVVRRQDAPVVYAMNASVYVWRTDILLKQQRVISGRVKLVEMPEDRSIDIDSEVDFKLVEILMEENRT
jgi:CMP-N,N'-diacetyllegionaminic acid synthase